MDYDTTTSDLANHAADKVRDALNSVLQLEPNTAKRFMIAVMAAQSCIAAASANLAKEIGLDESEASLKATASQVLELLLVNVTGGHDAALKHTERPSSFQT